MRDTATQKCGITELALLDRIELPTCDQNNSCSEDIAGSWEDSMMYLHPHDVLAQAARYNEFIGAISFQQHDHSPVVLKYLMSSFTHQPGSSFFVAGRG